MLVELSRVTASFGGLCSLSGLVDLVNAQNEAGCGEADKQNE